MKVTTVGQLIDVLKTEDPSCTIKLWGTTEDDGTGYLWIYNESDDNPLVITNF